MRGKPPRLVLAQSRRGGHGPPMPPPLDPPLLPLVETFATWVDVYIQKLMTEWLSSAPTILYILTVVCLNCLAYSSVDLKLMHWVIRVEPLCLVYNYWDIFPSLFGL